MELRRLAWFFCLVVLGPTSCSEQKAEPLRVVACGSVGLESEPCALAGETCACSGFLCPTYHDGFCTATCSDELVWTLEDCGRAHPSEGRGAGAGGEAGAAGAGGEAQ